VLIASQGLTGARGARTVRAAQLANNIGGDLVFSRRASMVVEGDLRADQASMHAVHEGR
jgi:hypothetical protein